MQEEEESAERHHQPQQQEGGGGGGREEDIFSWMFMNPDLFPARSTHHHHHVPLPPQQHQQQGVSLADDLFLEEDDVYALPPLPPSPVPTPPAASSASALTAASDEDEEDEDVEEDEAQQEQFSNKNEDKLSREKRLEKNREIARNCRKRKREKQQSLEEEVKKLREWNSQLEAKLLQIHPETLSKEAVRKREIDEIHALVTRANVHEEEIQEKLDQHREVYAAFGRERKQAISYHLEQLKSLLLPNQVSKMTLYVLQQEDDFYNEERNKTTFGGGIWNMLCEELELTGEQKNTLLNMRKEIRRQRQSVSQCLSVLRQLEMKIKENLQSSLVQMAKIQRMTTPSQQARFLHWIENNQAQIQVLNNLWEQGKGAAL